jgi:hypothetical protein
MCKELPVIPIKFRAEEEERHKGLLTQKKKEHNMYVNTNT